MEELSKKNIATILGCGALLIWSIEALLVSSLDRLPVFELAAMIFASGFSLTAIRAIHKNKWAKFKQPFIVWVVGILGICGSDFAYIYAIKLSPVEQIDLIDYMWPIFVILLSRIILKEKMYFYQILGGLISFVGIIFLLSDDGFLTLNPEYIHGYIIAILGALVWSAYSIFSRKMKELPIEMIGMYCGVAAIISLFLHITTEEFIMPTTNEGLFAFIFGVGGAGLAYQLWDYAAKWGDINFISLLNYSTPAISIGILIYFGKTEFTWNLAVACMLIIVGVSIGSVGVFRKTFMGMKKSLDLRKAKKLEMKMSN